MAALSLWRRKSEPASPYTESCSDFRQGLDKLHDPSDACVDVIFVHGLTGDRERTWTHPDALQPWPQKLLPAVIPNARILTYGYDAYVLGHRGPATTNRIGDHARDFLNELVGYRQQSQSLNRPLIFVAHSLGGLLCKDALLMSRNSADGHLRDAFDSIVAIAFMGTPHLGSTLAAWAKIPVASLGVLKSSTTSLLSVLQTDNDVLCRIQNDFLEMIRARGKTERGIEITCFYEALPMVLGKSTLNSLSKTIVPRDSATLAGFNSISIHADHRNIVRFTGPKDGGFRSLCTELSRWIDEVKIISTTQRPYPQLASVGHALDVQSTSLVPVDKSKACINYRNRVSPIGDTHTMPEGSSQIWDSTTLAPTGLKTNATSSFKVPSEFTALRRDETVSQPSRASHINFVGEPNHSRSSRVVTDFKDADSRLIDMIGPLGLNLLYEPKNTLVDLVFIHGLGGGSRRTWSCSNGSEAFWLQDYLPFENGIRDC